MVILPRSLAGLMLILSGTGVQAQSATPIQLPGVAVLSDRVANQQAAGTFTMPVTLLRFEPGVDVQERNLAEGQADIAIRGGTFENTAFKVGGLALYDPQTGHYSAEIPIAPTMLTAPAVLTGARHARSGWNATAGTVAYLWAPVRLGGEVEAGVGEHASYRGSLHSGHVGSVGNGRLGVDVAAAYSESAGAVANGDHQFSRVTARVQFAREGAQTDFVAGRQRKFLGWANLYTPFNSPESDDIDTTLLAFNHRMPQGANGGHFQFSAYHRENYDDYRFNRFAPVGPVLPFEHTTWVYGAAVDGRWAPNDRWAVEYRAGVVTDEIKSTSLVFGRYRSRTQLLAGIFPEWRRVEGDSGWIATAGLGVDDTNRDQPKFSPTFELVREAAGSPLRRWHVSYAQTTQMPGYTALNASSVAGLFRGNADLGRSTSRNLEAGVRLDLAGWEASAAVFHRQDDQLVDWTFRRGVTARSANAVDVDVTGAEVVLRRESARADLVLGYAWLGKDADYGEAGVDASFYALNFPEHRITAAIVVRLGKDWELRADNEARIQEENALRLAGGDDALLTAISLHWNVPAISGLRLTLQADNLWDDDFQEVPAVPAAGRQVSFSATYGW